MATRAIHQRQLLICSSPAKKLLNCSPSKPFSVYNQPQKTRALEQSTSVTRHVPIRAMSGPWQLTSCDNLSRLTIARFPS